MTSHSVYTSEGQGSGGDSQRDRVPDKNVALPASSEPVARGVGGGAGEGRTGRGPEKTPKERVLALLPNLSVGPMRCRDMVMGAQCPMQVKRGGWDLTHSPARRRRSAARQGEAGVLIRTDAQCFGDFLLRTPAQVTQLRAKGTSLRSVHLRS